MENKLIKLNEHYYLLGKGIPTGYYYDGFIKKIRNTNGAEYAQSKHVFPLIASTEKLFGIYLFDKEKTENLLGIFREEDWVFEISSGYAGYRNIKKGGWIYEAEYIQMKNKEIDVEKLAKKHVDDSYHIDFNTDEWSGEPFGDYRTYIKAYNQCLQDNADKRFNLIDIARVYEAGATDAIETNANESAEDLWKNNKEEVIGWISKKQKIEWDVEIETEAYTVAEMSKMPLGTVNQKPKVDEQGYINILSIK